MHKYRVRRWALASLLYLGCLPLSATDAPTASDADDSAPLSLIAPSAIAELKHRFRIDYMVESITILIKRQYETSPVVLILPDGTKWYSNRHPETVQWVDGIASDIITIHNPMPGPWQILGQLAPGSTIEKLSELSVEIDPLPAPIYQGERIKVSARLLSGEKLMSMPGMDYLIDWQGKLISNQRPGDENFAVGSYKAGRYFDNGEMLDERPDDGIFTGNLNLNRPWGHYTFQVLAKNRVFEREFNIPIELLPQPIKVSIIEPLDLIQGPWRVNIEVDDQHVRAPDSHVELTVVGPTDQWPLPLVVLVPGTNIIDLPPLADAGGYRIEGSIASTTVAGREIVLSLDDLFFNIPLPPPVEPSPAELAKQAAEVADAQTIAARSDAQFWIITINVTLLLLGLVGLLIWRKRQTMAQAMALAESRMLAQQQVKPNTKPATVDLNAEGASS
ncbi:TIGR03503 family protein [Shewanella sp. NIFS-20-20]|uniref:TIGR03503 family protein n=1 Tax=Shewanella sp. NIFS-20-20 TaxID=2853806 RepID=UPI001C454EE9|nr:TIGR03503 family protein [Shewanella sp. NIFS-20-20]MBV7316344.1 TIGR03503 family protein [Shewanella sp. NIFS-20-20]